MTILSSSLWRLAFGLALVAGILSCEQVQGRTTPPDTTAAGLSAGPPTGSPPAGGAPAVMIEMTRANRFFPDVVVVRPGDTIEWTNNSDVPHAVTDDPASAVHPGDVSSPVSAPRFDSGYVQPGKSFRYRFTVEGEYRYVCFLHETQGMSGTIVVTAKPKP